MNLPKRIQISRRRKDPPDTIRVTRVKRSGKRLDEFGNNYVVGKPVGHTHAANFDDDDYAKYGPHSTKGAIPVPSKEEAVRLFVKYQLPTYTDDQLKKIAARKHVGCWCPEGGPCHGDEYIKEINKRGLL